MRGLKCFARENPNYFYPVAPLAGAWIEIISYIATGKAILVAPLAGAWIEIDPSPSRLP